ncbi:MAG: group II intron reverse transcriptase domain-containing protein [Lachnospiraceae bacterium]|nr:group II intron reverse transcriptase domain-containing protein [Lachnospiraceae bacterium]
MLETPSAATFPLPKKSIISKQSTQKKRVVYTYPHAVNTVLKLLTYLLLREYDGLFCDNLYSFRPKRSARSAIQRLQKIPNLYQKYSYKVDVSNYFNSIPVDLLLPMLESATKEDPELYRFLKTLLEEPRVIDGSTDVESQNATPRIIIEEKGIMAGTPLASFYANLYLMDMDQYFYDQGIPYARYSDDVILFGDTMEEVQAHAQTIRRLLAEKGLSVNPKKEEFRSPEEGFVFLGFFIREGTIDVAPASVIKMKQKMRRKTRALQRWMDRNDITGDKAAKAFIRIFNRKLLESSMDNDLTWSYWYFSTINTDESLHVIDLYAQECLRYLLTGKHTKSRFNARYDDLKKYGYQTLVHAYHAFPKTNEKK